MQKVYIHDNCYTCQQIVNYIKQNNITCEIINISKNPEPPPIPIVIFPALFVNNLLTAYGYDIKNKLQPSNPNCISN